MSIASRVFMSDSRQNMINPSRRLPAVRLFAGSGTDPVCIMPTRCSALVVVLAHSTECTACTEFVNRLAEHGSELEVWDVSVRIVYPGNEQAAPRIPTGPIRALFDPERSLEMGLSAAQSVVIADEWGEIHEVVAFGDEHHFPDVHEIISWGRYLATRCPECEGETL